MIGKAATAPAAADLQALNTNGVGGVPRATILKAANGVQTLENRLKGRLNFGHRGQATGFTSLITLGDNNWEKIWARGNHRPTADVNDLDLGYQGNIDVFYNRAQ